MSAPERITVRCPHCDLMQFWTESSSCRRCHKAYVPKLLAPAVTVVREPQPIIAVGEQSNISRAVRFHRKRLGLSQGELAERLKAPRTWISKIESQGCLPTVTSLRRLAIALEITLHELIGVADMDVLKDPFMQQIAPYVRAISADNRNILLANLKQMNWKASYK